ncbi:MAG TPA: mechanosensitive ion channel family protein [Desulfomonilaceae bacterium]|nr:mechanosensitive ion channel family protein [Desulfomonilaceae bacterium]
MMEFINHLLAEMGIAPLLGAGIIGAATVIGAIFIRFLGDKIALAVSRWSKLGIRFQFFEIIQRPLWISVLLLGVLAETHWLTLPERADFLLSGATKTALAIAWMIVLGKTLGLISARLGGYYPGATELFRLSENIGIAAIGVVGGLMILTVWQINLTPLLASAGLLGIIVGLAAKDTLGNFFGGISVFLDRPFKPGDYIVLRSGERGKVVDIGLRSTRVVTRDDVLITIPNSVIVSTKIINESAPSRRIRVRVTISVANTSDVDQLEDVLLKVANANSLVLAEPEPHIRFRAFGDGSLEYELLCWTAQPKDKGRLIHQLNTAVFKSLNDAGIALPSPQREVFVHHISSDTSEQPPAY